LLASHHSYRLRLELSCREADWLVDRLMEAGPDRGVYGARITGMGGGGTVAALLDRSAASTEALLEVRQAYQQVTGLVLGITEG
jgi:L-arabinokinase